MRIPLYVIVGFLFLALFLFQEIFDLRWQYLQLLQADESYKRWSGLGLAVFILLQWSLYGVRISKKLESMNGFFTTIHKWMGAFTPLVFYVHSMRFGFTYLLALSLVFFGNFSLGLLNQDVLKIPSAWYSQGWMIVHVAFSLLVSMLMIYHVWIVFYYE